jgi:predicted phosphate transport protein (TIGR00153 family)
MGETKTLTTQAPPGFFSRIRAAFRSKPNRFIIRLGEQATITVAALDVLVEYMKKPNEKNAQKVHRFEQEADEVRRMLIDELNRTFVTPIDRQDIFALSRAIDDVIDYADSTILEMDVLSVKPNTYLMRMASLMRDAAEEIRLAMERLEKHPAVANEHAAKAKALENRMEGVYREAVADLFRGTKDLAQLVDMLKLREIYRHLSNAADRGDEAANIISDIIVKMT